MNYEEIFFKKMEKIIAKNNQSLKEYLLDSLNTSNENVIFLKDIPEDYKNKIIEKLKSFEEFENCSEIVIEKLPNTASGPVRSYNEPFKFTGKIGIYSFNIHNVFKSDTSTELEEKLLVRVKKY